MRDNQFFVPTALRVSDDYTMTYDVESSNNSAVKSGLNINAKEFVSMSTGENVSFSGPNGATPSALKHSKSSSHVTNGRQNGGHHSRANGHYIGNGSVKAAKDGRNGATVVTGSSPPLRVHFTDDTIAYDPDGKVSDRPL